MRLPPEKKSTRLQGIMGKLGVLPSLPWVNSDACGISTQIDAPT